MASGSFNSQTTVEDLLNIIPNCTEHALMQTHQGVSVHARPSKHLSGGRSFQRNCQVFQHACLQIIASLY
jgi:hypothetical protein